MYSMYVSSRRKKWKTKIIIVGVWPTVNEPITGKVLTFKQCQDNRCLKSLSNK